MSDLSDLYKENLSELVITSQSFGVLRKALFDNMGKNKAKAFLMRFGKELGTMKAKELMQKSQSIEYILEMARKTHRTFGHVSNVEIESRSLSIDNQKHKLKHAVGKWIDSFEVELHLVHHGMADECSCYTLSGYASGYMSVVNDQDIFVKELTCRSKGDAFCTFEVNTKEYWLQNSSDDLAIYDEQTIQNELMITYDELLSQRNLMEKMIKYHSQLTESIIHNNSIDNVVKTAYQILQIPIVIHDLNQNIITLCGIEKKTYKHLYLDKTKKVLPDKWDRITNEKIGQTQLMTTPIYLENKTFAYCSFIYLESQQINENDHFFLERLSIVAALCFVNEKISFETTERIKISILDRLINKQYSSLNEITSQLKYAIPNTSGPFITLSIKCFSKKLHSSSIDLYDQLLELSKALNMYHVDGLLSQHKDKIILLIFSVDDISFFHKTLNKIVSHRLKINKDIEYKIGVSKTFDNLSQFEIALEQAEQSVNFPRQQSIIQFDELGLLGNLMEGINIHKLKETAKQELGKLLEPDEKNKELLYTLYIYLVNGGKLEKTMNILSLSIGGIQYRIRKVEDTIQKDLKDFSVASYLLLLIESLILIGELKFH